LEVVQIPENVEITPENSRRGSINESLEVHKEVIIEDKTKDQQN